MEPTIVLTIALLIALPAVFWIAVWSSAGRIAAQYRVLAERFGLELEQPTAKFGGFVRPEPSLYGRYRGREVSISALAKGYKNMRQIETLLKVRLGDRRLTAQLAAAGLLGALRQRDSGGQARWKSGDPVFDQAVDVRTNHGEQLAVALTPDRRAQLAEVLRKGKASLYIGDGVIAYAELGMIASERVRMKFETMVELACDLADAIEA